MDENFYKNKLMNNMATNGFIEWARGQSFFDPVVLTFCSPELGDRDVWESVVQRAIIEFNHKIKRKLPRKLKIARGNFIKRIFAIGRNSYVNTPYHAHGLIEGLGIDEKIFFNLLESIWVKHVARYFSDEQIEKTVTDTTRVHQGCLYGDGDRYLNYILRPEEVILGYGMEKILIKSLYLGEDSSDSKAMHIETLPESWALLSDFEKHKYLKNQHPKY